MWEELILFGKKYTSIYSMYIDEVVKYERILYFKLNK